MCFSKENWHRGGTEKIQKSAGRAARAIGVLRTFKSSVFAWRFFYFLRDVRNGMIGFNTTNDKVVLSLDVFFNFFGTVRNGMVGFLLKIGKSKKRKDRPQEPQVRYGRTEFLKVVFSLDVFSTFLGQSATEWSFFDRKVEHRGGTAKIGKSAGRAASAIGVLRIFKSDVSA